MLYIFVNGKILDSESPAIKVFDRGMVFGDGLYDVIKMQNGNFIFLEDHIERMKKSAKFFGIKFPYDLEEIFEIGQKLSTMNDLKEGELYLQLTRGVDIIRDHVFEDDYEPTFVEIVQPVRKMNPEIWQVGARVLLHPDLRHNFCEHKTTDLLPNVIAKKYVRSRGAYEALMFRTDEGGKYVTEGASSSYIFFDGEKIIAPKIENILPGITRIKVLWLAKEMDIEVEERRVYIDELLKMKEVILLSTLSRVLPIVKVENFEFKKGEIAKKLDVAFMDLCASHLSVK
ncbi:MAG: aminotransferase class IV [Athalassotoga sp.]|uniref:aminotransferase class IV n=1 Tax=Athalassotoga sp. TaxID=2022597 RepID=UPI003CFFE28F